MTVGSSDGLSDIKGVHLRIESPYAIRRFMDTGDHQSAMSTYGHIQGVNKIHERLATAGGPVNYHTINTQMSARKNI